ncbi:hypothetical protein Bpla01_25610 [Burkholderia plantarii]|nr:hypothetical protein Bpla01_25610 [Burkholderia plantarii]
MADEALGRPRVEQVGIVFEHAGEAARALLQLEVEIVFRGAGVEQAGLDLEAVERERVQRAAHHVEHHLEQRRVRERARRPGAIDDFVERQVGVVEGVEHGVARLGQQGAEAGRRLEAQAQRQQVGVETDALLAELREAVRERAADHDVAGRRITVEQGAERGKARHVGRHAGLAGQLAKRLGERRIEREA